MQTEQGKTKLDFKDKLNKFQAFLLDKMARKCARGRFLRKKAFVKFLVRFLKIMPFSRWAYTVDSIARHLKLSVPEAEKLTCDSFESFITNAFEMSSLKYLTHDELLNKLQVNGLNNLEAALAQKKGAIYIAPVIQGFNMVIILFVVFYLFRHLFSFLPFFLADRH